MLHKANGVSGNVLANFLCDVIVWSTNISFELSLAPILGRQLLLGASFDYKRLRSLILIWCLDWEHNIG